MWELNSKVHNILCFTCISCSRLTEAFPVRVCSSCRRRRLRSCRSGSESSTTSQVTIVNRGRVIWPCLCVISAFPTRSKAGPSHRVNSRSLIMDVATSAQNNVVDRQELLEILYAASSQIPSQVQASTERLKSLLDSVGTYDALHEIAAEKSLPLPVRQQSIIQFKNSALSHWRSRKYAGSCPLQLLAKCHR